MPYLESLPTMLPNTQSLPLAKRAYPALADVPEAQLSLMSQDIWGNLEKKHILLEAKHSTLAPPRETYMEAIDQWQLPEGWGDFFVSLTQPLVEGIPLGMSSTELAAYAGDPYLALLLKLILTYALFTESENETEEAHLGALAGTAQELVDVLAIMPKLRHGGTRFLQRLVNCIDRMINLQW